jgi:hypothetical protein
MSRAETRLQKTVALMPLLFAAQQAAEGLLWMSLTRQPPAPWTGVAKYTFLVFAEMLWPVYMPLIAVMAGKPGPRRMLQSGLLALGVVLALQLTYGLVGWPVFASIHAGHMHYELRYPPVNAVYYGGLYLVATVLPLLLSHHRLFRLLGFGLAVSYAASRIFYNHDIISIWCYFSAFLSFIAVAIVLQLRRGAAPELSGTPQTVPSTHQKE